MIQVNAWRGGGRGGGGRGGGRGGSRGGGRGGWGGRGARGGYTGGRGAGRFGGPARSISTRGGHFGKGVYGATRTGHYGGGGPGSFSYSARYNSRGQLQSISRGYGPMKSGGTYGQPGTNRGSFRISMKNFAVPGSSFGRRGGTGVSRSTAVSPGTGGGDDGGDDSPTTPPGSGRERSLRIRNSPARRTAFGRGRRAQGSRRSLRIGRSVGGLGSGQSRSGVNV